MLSLQELRNNIYEICSYGFTEIFNNAIDHSDSTVISASIALTAASVKLEVVDQGVGIFRKIKNALNLEDERLAILELAKGKFTTDPQKHSGQGIFFSSRAFDIFEIYSSGLLFCATGTEGDWLIGESDPDSCCDGYWIIFIGRFEGSF